MEFEEIHMIVVKEVDKGEDTYLLTSGKGATYSFYYKWRKGEMLIKEGDELIALCLRDPGTNQLIIKGAFNKTKGMELLRTPMQNKARTIGQALFGVVTIPLMGLGLIILAFTLPQIIYFVLKELPKKKAAYEMFQRLKVAKTKEEAVALLKAYEGEGIFSDDYAFV